MRNPNRPVRIKTYSVLYCFPRGQIGLPQLGYIIVEATNAREARKEARWQVASGKYKVRWGPVLV